MLVFHQNVKGVPTQVLFNDAEKRVVTTFEALLAEGLDVDQALRGTTNVRGVVSDDIVKWVRHRARGRGAVGSAPILCSARRRRTNSSGEVRHGIRI